MGGLLGELSRYVTGIEGAAQRLHAVQRDAGARCGARGPASGLQEAEARLEAARRRHAAAESPLRAEVERLRAGGCEAPPAAQAAEAEVEDLPLGTVSLTAETRTRCRIESSLREDFMQQTAPSSFHCCKEVKCAEL